MSGATPEAVAFKDGDRVRISETPGTGPEPNSGYVSPDFAGKKGVVRLVDVEGCAYVVADGFKHDQIIHPAHLTKIVDEV